MADNIRKHYPSPVPERGIYGFVLYVGAYLTFGLYLIWAFIPEPWLHAVGITYLPQRYWVFAAPVYLMVLVVLTFFTYNALSLIMTPPLHSIQTITDEYARYNSKTAETNKEPGSIPPLYDVHITKINQVLYQSED